MIRRSKRGRDEAQPTEAARPDDASAVSAPNDAAVAAPSAGETSAETPTEPIRPPLTLPSPPLVHPVLGFSLRPWGTTPTDADALVAAWADPEVARFTEVPKAQDIEAANRWISKEERRRTSGAALDLVVSELGAPENIWGEVGLVMVEHERRWAEIGYWMTPAARGLGVATGAVTLVAGWAVRNLPVARLVARTHPDNPASAVVAERAGFAPAGTLPDGTSVWTVDAG